MKETARLLAENIRSTDFLFRWGGEEFALLCSNTNSEQAATLAEGLRELLSKVVLNYAQHEIKLTGSFGIASYPEHGTSQSELFLAADSALYQAKSGGRNQVCLAQTQVHLEEH